MKEIILIKNGELALKGLNRRNFEDVLIKNINTQLKNCGGFSVLRAQSTITIIPNDDFLIDKAEKALKKVFGIAAYTKAAAVEKDMSVILETAAAYLQNTLKNAKTFKVEPKRSDKKFSFKSPEICAEVGGKLLSTFTNLKVDVHNPEVTVMVEIRDDFAYIHTNQIKGAGGMPVGTSGKAAVLISGGIDSPVASYMMAKRGVKLMAIHFASPPYTSLRAELKVKKLLSKVAAFSGDIKLFIVPFTEIQTKISEQCPEEYFTLIMRRFMMKISEEIAKKENALALITGESLGQVASQTLPAIVSTDSVISIPVFRPLIGMDKGEITKISRDIDTFDISIEPYEDCCTVFTPKHPRTNPKLDAVKKAEENLNSAKLIEKAIIDTKYEYINAFSFDN